MKNLLTLNPLDPPITRDHVQGRHPRRRREGSRRRGRDEDRNSGSPTTPARCQHQKWPVHSREESKRLPDNAPSSAPTAHGITPVLWATAIRVRCQHSLLAGGSAGRLSKENRAALPLRQMGALRCVGARRTIGRSRRRS